MPRRSYKSKSIMVDDDDDDALHVRVEVEALDLEKHLLWRFEG